MLTVLYDRPTGLDDISRQIFQFWRFRRFVAVYGKVLPLWGDLAGFRGKLKLASGYALIALISGVIPMMFMTRFKLYASTCRAISVPTRLSVFIWK